MKEDDDEKELKELFRVLDKQKKGEVPVGDLRWILKELGEDFTEEEIDEMIASVDTDSSGWVDYDGTCIIQLWVHILYIYIHALAKVRHVLPSFMVSQGPYIKTIG